MKKLTLIFGLVLGLAAGSARATVPTLIDTPIATNSIAGTNAPFWAGGPPASPLQVWQLVQLVKTNFAMLQAFMGALTDADTNAITSSPKAIYATTNSLTIPYAGFVTNWVVTNYAGMDYTVIQGNPFFYYSTDGIHYTNFNVNLITNVPVWLKFSTQTNIPALASPIDCILTNVTVYTLARPDLFGKTNAVYGEHLFSSVPLLPDEVANKKYVDGLYQATAWWSAQNDVQLNSHTLNWSPVWSTMADTSTTNADNWHLSYLGVDALTVSEPKAQGLTNASIAMGGTGGTNLVVSVPTNGLASAPRLQATRYISPATWAWMTNTPSVVGTNYQFTFALPWSDSGFYMALVPSTLPAAVTLAGVLQLTPRTITNSTDTTWGYGAGLVSVDGSYLYVSTGTNAWKRVALTGW